MGHETSSNDAILKRLTEYSAPAVEAPPAPTEAPATAHWEGVLGVEGTVTGDGRLIEPDALRWETPFPIRFVRSDVGGHDGAEVAGTCTHVERRDGGVIWGSGPFDMGGEAGREAYRVVNDEVMNGVSMDLDDVSFEVRVARELFDEVMGDPITEEDGEDALPAEEVDDEGRVTVVKMEGDSEVMVTTDARIRAVTLVAIPAFVEAKIAVSTTPAADTETADADDSTEAAAVTASASPKRPPREWFQDPGLDGPTPLTVTKDGRVFGHLATWGTCHITHALEGECLEPPTSASGYAYFRTGSIETAEGDDMPVGRITVNTKHADTRPGKFSLTPAAVMEHYDNTGSAAAYVAAGEDQYGIWVAGSVKPGASRAHVDVLRASPLSGDWRTVGGRLELLAVLAVNGPGYPVPRPSGLVASGRLVALTASSGMLAPRDTAVDDIDDIDQDHRLGGRSGLSASDVRWLMHLAGREKKAAVDALAARVQRTQAARAQKKVRAFAARRKQ